MRTRILVFSSDHQPVMALDIHGDRERAQSTMDANLQALLAEGITDPVVIHVDPIADADTHVRNLQAIERLRLETRAIPGGGTEIQDVYCLPRIAEGSGPAALARQCMATPARVARAFRIVRAPADIAGARTPILRKEAAR